MGDKPGHAFRGNQYTKGGGAVGGGGGVTVQKDDYKERTAANEAVNMAQGPYQADAAPHYKEGVAEGRRTEDLMHNAYGREAKKRTRQYVKTQNDEAQRQFDDASVHLANGRGIQAKMAVEDGWRYHGNAVGAAKGIQNKSPKQPKLKDVSKSGTPTPKW